MNSLGASQRTDKWWVAPLLTALGLTAFGIYSTWAALQGNHYRFGPYLSPFYSPLFLLDWWPWSPALLILWAPLSFRATCYYYRKAYYRSFFLDPPACAVGEFREHSYSGETKFPFILQNIHRFCLFFAVLLLIFLWSDVFEAFHFEDGFGIGVGTIVLLANTTFLSFYTLGCHSLRHLIGGGLNCFSCTAGQKVRHKAWKGATLLNKNHMLWAWVSLFMVGFADLYVRLCAMGILTDFRIF